TGNGLPDGILGRIGISVSGADSNRVYAIIEAKEGGIFRSDDAGEKWTKVNDDGRFRQRAWYFSKIYADPKSVDTVYVLHTGAFASVVPDQCDWHIIYSNSEGDVVRYDKNKEEGQDVSVWPMDHSGHGAVDLPHRFQWVTPLFLSPHNPDVLYTAAECVFKSTDHGMSWTQISNDLTKNDKSKQQPSGGPLTNDITSVEYYDTVFALAESPKKQGTLWAGTDDGLVHVTTDDGKSWANVTPK